jgi:hypothetical protein
LLSTRKFLTYNASTRHPRYRVVSKFWSRAHEPAFR